MVNLALHNLSWKTNLSVKAVLILSKAVPLWPNNYPLGSNSYLFYYLNIAILETKILAHETWGDTI